LVITTQSEGISLQELGGSLAIGIFISAVLTIIIGLAGLGVKLSTLFSDSVMGVFMFLFVVQLIPIFLIGVFDFNFVYALIDNTYTNTFALFFDVIIHMIIILYVTT